MKKTITLIALTGLLLANVQAASAQSVTIGGVLQLESQPVHSSVEVLFKRIAPAPLENTTVLTNSNGVFSVSLPSGIYEITYKKAGYFSVFLGQINCFNNLSLPSKTLFKRSTKIRVPDHFTSIQHAIDDSFAGDTILLEPLTYFENINIRGREVLITSHYMTTKNSYYIENTVIDGGGKKTVIVCDNFETDKTILSGFTIRNGNAVGQYPDYFGGGIRCHRSSPTLEHLIIKDNNAQYGGGGIYMIWSSSTITNTRIINNTCGRDGGGIRITSSSPVIKNCIIARNKAEIGGGITCTLHDQVGNTKIVNSTIAYNTVTSTSQNDFNGGAGIKITGANLSVTNSIIAYNTGDYGISFYNQNGWVDYPLLSYNNFFSNGTGNLYQCNPLNGPIVTQNINQDPVDAFFNLFASPMFTDPAKDDFSLSLGSQSIDAGNNSLINLSVDIDNFKRVQNDNNLSEARVNLGAKEKVTGSASPVFEKDRYTICPNSLVTFNITSEGDLFTWSRFEDGSGYLFQSGKTVVFDTITTSVTLYVGNATHTQPSPRTPVQITVQSTPGFSILHQPVDHTSYQFSASSNTGIKTYLWTITGTNQSSAEATPVFTFPESGTYEICLQAANTECGVKQCEEFDFVITGLFAEGSSTEFQFFPNPVQEQLQIKSKDGRDLAVEIKDATGKTMYAGKGESRYEVPFNNVAPGIYFLALKRNDMTGKPRVFKILKTDR